jgi:hypothetical protein
MNANLFAQNRSPDFAPQEPAKPANDKFSDVERLSKLENNLFITAEANNFQVLTTLNI